LVLVTLRLLPLISSSRDCLFSLPPCSSHHSRSVLTHLLVMSRPASGSGPLTSRRCGVAGAQTDSGAQGTIRTRAAAPSIPQSDAPAAMSSRRLSLRSHTRSLARPSDPSLDPCRAPSPRRPSTDSEAVQTRPHSTQVPPQPQARSPVSEARSTTLALFSNSSVAVQDAPTETSARKADQSFTGRARSGSSPHDSLLLRTPPHVSSFWLILFG
jgi:hypothetical protein